MKSIISISSTCIISLFIFLCCSGSYQKENKENTKKSCIIFQGFNENLKISDSQNPVVLALTNMGYEVLLINSKYSDDLFFDSTEIKQIINEVGTDKNIESLIIGGFSIGGSGALKLAEYVKKNNLHMNLSGIFIIDSPLDYERLYKSSAILSKISNIPESKNEADFIVQQLRANFGCTAYDCAEKYWKNSIYSKYDTVYKNYITLKDYNILLISNTDFGWQMNNRMRSVYDMNLEDILGLYQSLLSINAQKVHLSLTNLNETKAQHPHSWNNVDIEKFKEWLKSIR
jgi:hypothetical protein